jgi:hypothetical protein
MRAFGVGEKSDGGWWLTESNRGRGGAVIAVTMRALRVWSVEEMLKRGLERLAAALVKKTEMREEDVPD